MKTDKFWKYFLSVCAVVLIGGGATVYGLIQYVAPQQLPAIVLPTAEDLVDNTAQAAELPTLTVATTSNNFYSESVPFGFDYWAWGAQVNWRSGSHYYEGSRSIGATFTEPWGGIGIEGPGTITRGYNGISLAIFAQQSIENLYIELHDKNDRLIGRQALGWYSPNRTLLVRQWYNVTIPFSNFSGAIPAQIGRVSIIARGTGTAHIDSIRLVRNAAPTERWNEQSEAGAASPEAPTLSQLLTNTTAAPLPYQLQLTPIAAGLWYALAGTFQFAATEALLGLTGNSTISTAIFLGGKSWGNYRADAVVNWGTATTFSLLARYADENNYTSCAFSAYGRYVQIYQVRNGESIMIAEAPELPIPHFDPRKDAAHGVEVSGNRISCYLHGEKVLSAELSNLPSQGSVGLRRGAET